MNDSEISLIKNLIEQLEVKNQRILELHLDHQREHWQKQLVMLDRDMEQLCHELRSSNVVTDKAKQIMKRQMFCSLKSSPTKEPRM